MNELPVSARLDAAAVTTPAAEVKHRFEATIRLAERVSHGEVVFFVGSGFSIDSEGNTANRLIGRLLAGVLAMDTVLAEERVSAQDRGTLAGLRTVFGLDGAAQRPGCPPEPARCMTDENIKLLAREYYNFNEWSVSTFSVLSRELLAVPKARQKSVVDRIEQLGTFLLTLVGDRVPLQLVPCHALNAFATDEARGKALFLDVMGFADGRVMGGDPAVLDIETVAVSYGDRLRPRHHALARLAREGLAPAVVTTNYDLLLEGAYRLAGFLPGATDGRLPDDFPIPVAPRFSAIAGAEQFFTRGEGYRTALLLKIHGSVDVYRTVRDLRLRALDSVVTDAERGVDRWSSYLPAIVFTYREIQTWRADAWSRDLIRTLLRTHSLVLCGYSAADPIMHATFREVYEERAASVAARPPQMNPTDSPPATRKRAREAPAFFFGVEDRREFHSLEILRAATVAAGCEPVKLLDHPNLIEFAFSGGFPTVDDHFRLIAHCVVRDLQLEALKSRLRGLAPRVLGHACPETDYDGLVRGFAALCASERADIVFAGDRGSKTPAHERRRRFDAVVGWTWYFAAGLLREIALAEFAESRQGPGRGVRTNRSCPWYQAASERLEWTAWAAVVELALRRMVAAWRSGSDRPGIAGDSALTAEESPHAVIAFANDGWQPSALCIRLGGFDRPGRPPTLKGAFRKVVCWEFGEGDVPWPLARTGLCPPAKVIWDYAAGGRVDAKIVAHDLGVAT